MVRAPIWPPPRKKKCTCWFRPRKARVRPDRDLGRVDSSWITKAAPPRRSCGPNAATAGTARCGATARAIPKGTADRSVAAHSGRAGAARAAAPAQPAGAPEPAAGNHRTALGPARKQHTRFRRGTVGGLGQRAHAVVAVLPDLEPAASSTGAATALKRVAGGMEKKAGHGGGHRGASPVVATGHRHPECGGLLLATTPSALRRRGCFGNMSERRVLPHQRGSETRVVHELRQRLIMIARTRRSCSGSWAASTSNDWTRTGAMNRSVRRVRGSGLQAAGQVPTPGGSWRESPDILTRFAPLNHDRAVGRVAPRAPPRRLKTQNGAHGVTRPTLRFMGRELTFPASETTTIR